MKRLITALILILTSGLNSVQAGVVVGGTRIIYPANQSEVQIALKNKDNEKYFTEMKYYFGEEKVKIVSEYTESEMKWEIFMKVVFTDEYCFLFTIPYQGLCVNIEALNKNEIDELRLIIKSNIDENIITYL